jgi:hypothetical protein
VLADRFDGSKGKIKLTVKDSSPGQPGAPGQNLTVVCKEVVGLMLNYRVEKVSGLSWYSGKEGKHGALPETKMVDLVGKVEKANLAAMGGKVET